MEARRIDGVGRLKCDVHTGPHDAFGIPPRLREEVVLEELGRDDLVLVRRGTQRVPKSGFEVAVEQRPRGVELGVRRGQHARSRRRDLCGNEPVRHVDGVEDNTMIPHRSTRRGRSGRSSPREP